MKPWHDCPRCVCGGPLVGYGLRDQAKRLRCCACGDEVVGSDDEVARAQRADAAWERERERWSDCFAVIIPPSVELGFSED